MYPGTIYLIDLAQLIGALYVVRPWTTEKTKTPTDLTGTSIAVFLAGCLFFRLLSHFGLKLLDTLPVTMTTTTAWAGGIEGGSAAKLGAPSALEPGLAGTPPRLTPAVDTDAPRAIARRLDLVDDGLVGGHRRPGTGSDGHGDAATRESIV